MTDDAFFCVFGAHATAVVGDPHIGLAAVGNFHLNGTGAGVDGVFDEFFDARRRPFDDFTGSDFIARSFI